MTPTQPVKIAITLGYLNPRAWVDATVEADRLGYESVWLPEHLVLPVHMGGSPHAGDDHPPIPPNIHLYDPFTYLAFLAGQTERIRFGTQVFNIGLRHPFVTARAAATFDVVSGGRFDFGIGASWLKEEWDAIGLEFHTRGRRVDEALGICKRLWSDEVVEHHGEFFDFAPVMFEPKPLQAGGPPIHVGGDGAAALRRAATIGDGWIPMNHTIDDLPASIARLTELREQASRSKPIEITVGGDDIGSVDDLKRYAEAGVDRVIVRPWQRSSEAVDGLRRFADDVLAKLS